MKILHTHLSLCIEDFAVLVSALDLFKAQRTRRIFVGSHGDYGLKNEFSQILSLRISFCVKFYGGSNSRIDS